MVKKSMDSGSLLPDVRDFRFIHWPIFNTLIRCLFRMWRQRSENEDYRKSHLIEAGAFFLSHLKFLAFYLVYVR
ncbi:uncharacterized protein V1518DRAFT_409750 [Limtongia smithiae]|uniref:uncharacterized protein n=1 Tax=Limtongia smithiae TaxID=1125753 RepID=UPI0034CF78DE